MSPAEYDGAPRIQKHYSPTGELVGITETESAWDDDSRAEAEALYEADALICSKCGNPRALCSDPNAVWYPQRTVCYAAMSGDAADRQYDDKHSKRPFHDGNFSRWSDNATGRSPFHYRAGVTVWSSQYDLTPDDDFL